LRGSFRKPRAREERRFGRGRRAGVAFAAMTTAARRKAFAFRSPMLRASDGRRAGMGRAEARGMTPGESWTIPLYVTIATTLGAGVIAVLVIVLLGT
jgi:hypothetical protein